MVKSIHSGLKCVEAASSLLTLCRQVLDTEAAAIAGYAARVGHEFTAALRLLHGAQDPVVVSGIGKSGHIARKVASTFCSIGRSAVFLHPVEASHGDLGLVGKTSVALILSNSGETPELSDLISYCEKYCIPIVLITAIAESRLGQRADVTLAYGKVEEACPNGLAPTTSTTLALAIGDALAMGLVHLRGITPADFHRYHPSGKLSARLLTVGALMHSGNRLPLVAPDLPMQKVIIIISAKGFGVALVAERGRVIGIITDGDMRRNVDCLLQSKARDLILGKPLTITPEKLALQALEIMSMQGATCLVVENKAGELQGLIHIHDCVRAGVRV